MLEIIQRKEGDITIFVLDGRVDSDGVLVLENSLHEAISQAHYKLILDMGEVRYMNSAGLRILADILTVTRDNGGDLRLVNMNPKVTRVFEIIGFHKFFLTYDTVIAALGDF